MSTTPADRTKTTTPLNPWAVYGICLLISAVFFFFFGYNSPIYTFNSDHDYNWFMTMGHGLVAGKIPYRDLFEHKGPIVYFVTAFCCLFPHPNIVMLILEIISMSLFFFFAYRLAGKYLNTFYSLIAVLILAVAIFTSWCRIRSADALEEFSLPIYAYFLLCWLEFLIEKRHWTWLRALCLGLCFAVLLWSKFTLVYFMLVPMIVWFIISIRRRQYRIMIINILCMLAGAAIITLPIIIFFAATHALGDLFHIYFIINLTSYGTTSIMRILRSFGLYFTVGPLVLGLILWGIVSFAIRHWRERAGWILLIAFLVNSVLLIWSSKGIIYYYGGLVPYAILGVIDILTLISSKLTIQRYHKLILTGFALACMAITIPFSILTYEWGRGKDEYTPLVIADVIHKYEKEHNITATMFCYKIGDFGFYNAAGIVPNNYYFVNNFFSEKQFPAMYEAFNSYITEQTSDFIVTKLATWEKEYDTLSPYYQLYTDTVYHYRQVFYYYYKHFDFVLLIRTNL